jgi:hypothetical protein
MRIKFFYEDLNENALGQIRQLIRDRLQEKITETSEQLEIDPEQVETELVDDYLNRHNCGFVIQL